MKKEENQRLKGVKKTHFKINECVCPARWLNENNISSIIPAITRIKLETNQWSDSGIPEHIKIECTWLFLFLRNLVVFFFQTWTPNHPVSWSSLWSRVTCSSSTPSTSSRGGTLPWHQPSLPATYALLCSRYDSSRSSLVAGVRYESHPKCRCPGGRLTLHCQCDGTVAVAERPGPG